MSHGGTSVLSAVSTETVSMFEPFQAAVAFYPWCDDVKEINAPLLLGHTLRYDADATSDAVMKVQQFLEQHLN